MAIVPGSLWYKRMCCVCCDGSDHADVTMHFTQEFRSTNFEAQVMMYSLSRHCECTRSAGVASVQRIGDHASHDVHVL